MPTRIVNRSLSFFGLAALAAALVLLAGGNGLSANQQKDAKKAAAEAKKEAEAQQKAAAEAQKKAAAEEKKREAAEKKRLEELQKKEAEHQKRIAALTAKELEAYRKKQAEIVKRAEEAMRLQALDHLKGGESEALKEAYILMAAANHDYNGHRAKAMGAVARATEVFDKDVLKGGTVADRIKTIQDNQVAAAARFLEKGDTTVHEPQFYSDLQLRQAGILVQEVKAYMVKNNQTKGMNHVDDALKELTIALQTR